MTARPSGADAAASRMIEAMRLGVVPSSDVSAFTVGRDGLLRRIEAGLGDAASGLGSVLTILGDYGTGKTHSLELVAQRALDGGFLVAHATLGAEETAPSHPARVYRALVRSLAYPDRGGASEEGLRPLFDLAVRSPEAVEAFGLDLPNDADPPHLYLSPALRYWGALHLDDPAVLARRPRQRVPVREWSDEHRAHIADTLLGWFEASYRSRTAEIREEIEQALGRQGQLFAMKDYRPWSRIYGYILSGLADLARTVGYSGLVVLLDEAEFYHVLGSEDRDYARTLFQAMAYAACGPRDDLPFDPQELDIGGRGALRDVPARASHDSPMCTVFAMTPAAETDEDVLHGAVPPGSRWELTHLDGADYAELAERVLEVYFRLRPSRVPSDALAKALGSTIQRLRADGRIQTPRHAMKFIIDLLDVLHFRPKDVRRVLSELREVIAGSRGTL